MLKKRLGLEAFERDWYWKKSGSFIGNITGFFKIPTTLIIPEGCRSIGEAALCYCKKLEKIVIPKSVEKIKYKAFYDCSRAVIILKKPRIEIETEICVFLGCKAVMYVKEEIRS